MKRQHAILTLIVAAMAVLTAGCQKEKESGTVTLAAEIQETLSGNGKVFIDGDTPCWHNGDEVFINNAAITATRCLSTTRPTPSQQHRALWHRLRM